MEMPPNPSNFSANPQRSASPAWGMGCTPGATWDVNVAQCSSTSPSQTRFHLQPAPSAWSQSVSSAEDAHLPSAIYGAWGSGSGEAGFPWAALQTKPVSAHKSSLALSLQRTTFQEESTSRVRDLPTPNSTWAGWGLTFLHGKLNCHDWGVISLFSVSKAILSHNCGFRNSPGQTRLAVDAQHRNEKDSVAFPNCDEFTVLCLLISFPGVLSACSRDMAFWWAIQGMCFHPSSLLPTTFPVPPAERQH